MLKLDMLIYTSDTLLRCLFQVPVIRGWLDCLHLLKCSRKSQCLNRKTDKSIFHQLPKSYWESKNSKSKFNPEGRNRNRYSNVFEKGIQKCEYLLDENAPEIFENLTELEKNLQNDIKAALVYIVDYVVKNDIMI